MSYDLVIKNGMIVDGSGGVRYRGDVGVKNGQIDLRILEPDNPQITTRKKPPLLTAD